MEAIIRTYDMNGIFLFQDTAYSIKTPVPYHMLYSILPPAKMHVFPIPQRHPLIMYKNLMSYITEDTIRFFSFLSPNEKVYQRKGVKFVEECGFPRYNKGDAKN